MYLAVALRHHAAVSNLEVAWTAIAFNLLVLNIIGLLTAVLAHAYRSNRTRLLTVALGQTELVRRQAGGLPPR